MRRFACATLFPSHSIPARIQGQLPWDLQALGPCAARESPPGEQRSEPLQESIHMQYKCCYRLYYARCSCRSTDQGVTPKALPQAHLQLVKLSAAVVGSADIPCMHACAAFLPCVAALRRWWAWLGSPAHQTMKKQVAQFDEGREQGCSALPCLIAGRLSLARLSRLTCVTDA